MKKLFNKIDSTFEKLFDVVCNNLSREQTRDLLKEFYLQELPDVDNVRAELFSRPSIVPTNVICVFYRPDGLAGKANINIGYPKYVPKFISKVHRKQLLRKLDKFFNKRFGAEISCANGIYWQSGDTLIIRNLKETDTGKASGAPYIGIEVFDNKIYPKEKALEKIKG